MKKCASLGKQCQLSSKETKREGTTNGLLQFHLLAHLDINLEGSGTCSLRMLRYHTDPRYRWPLALRFIKGAIHGTIILPVLLHAAFAALVVALDKHVQDLGLPASIVCLGDSANPRNSKSLHNQTDSQPLHCRWPDAGM